MPNMLWQRQSGGSFKLQCLPWGSGPPCCPRPSRSSKGLTGAPVQWPSCPSEGCLYEYHLQDRASLVPTENQSCVTLTNRTGFLCHDRRHCIPAHRVCDGIRTCPHGEDEDESLCREYPLHPASLFIPLQPPQLPLAALWNILRHRLHSLVPEPRPPAGR